MLCASAVSHLERGTSNWWTSCRIVDCCPFIGVLEPRTAILVINRVPICSALVVFSEAAVFKLELQSAITTTHGFPVDTSGKEPKISIEWNHGGLLRRLVGIGVGVYRLQGFAYSPRKPSTTHTRRWPCAASSSSIAWCRTSVCCRDFQPTPGIGVVENCLAQRGG